MTNDTLYFSIIVIELRVRYFTSPLTFPVWFSSANCCLNSVKNTAKEKKKKTKKDQNNKSQDKEEPEHL